MKGGDTHRAGAWLLCFGHRFRCPVVSFPSTAFFIYLTIFDPFGQIRLNKQKKNFKNRLIPNRKEGVPLEQCYQ
jgi:hypothetical protein